MVTLNNVSFGYDDTPVLTNVSLTLPERGTVCLFGASGRGKTTVLRLLAGLETPTSGEIVCDKKQVAVVFQEDRLLPWLTVRENVELVSDTQNPTLVDDCLRAVSLFDEANELPAQLSGGMRRRVALARALAFGGDLLLLDEPFNGLDHALKVQIAEALQKRFADCPIVLVTHSTEEAALFNAQIVTL